MKLIIDSCSIILLAKSATLEDLAKWEELIITKGVYNEVIEGKEKKFLDALLLERLTEEKLILIKDNINKASVHKISNDFGLGMGEAETIILTLTTKDSAIVTDNKQGRKAAKVYGLKLLGSIDIIIALYKRKKISQEKAVNALRILKDKGWFQNYLIDEALKEVQNG